MVASRQSLSGTAIRSWRGAAGRRAGSSVGSVLLVLGLAVACFVLGVASVIVGAVSADRPAFAVALPLLIAIAFTFVLFPKALLVAIVVLRGGTDPLFQGTQLAGVGGLGGLLNLAVIGLAFIFVLQDPKRLPRAAWWAWLPFMAMQFVGLAYSPDLFPSFRLVLGQTSTFAMFVLAFYLVDDFRSLDKALRLVLMSSVLVAAVSIVAIARGQTASTLDGMETVSGRYGGPFPHPNILAFYLVLVIGVVLYLWKGARSTAGWFAKAAYMLYVLLLLGLLLATKTRSAWLAAGFLFFLYGILVERRYLLYLLAVPALALLIPEFRDRVLDLGQGNAYVQYAKLNSFAWRKLMWTSGLQWMARSHYFAGYGLGSFLYHSATFFPMSGGLHMGAHSVPVQLFFEMGIPGVSTFFYLFIASFRLLWRGRRADLLLCIVFGSALGTYLIVSASDNMLAYTVFNWYFWFTIGGACAAVAKLPEHRVEASAVDQHQARSRSRLQKVWRYRP